MSLWAKIVLAVIGGPLLLVALAGIIADIREAGSKPSETASPDTPPAQSQLVEPTLANVTLHAFSLIKDPYSHRGQMVTLNVTERPLLYEGSVIRYVDVGGGDLGMTGLRLNRMMSENAALYDILGMDADGDSQMLGQLVVVLPPTRRDLELGRFWEVEPLGVVEGTNGFGAPIQVPEVRFWRYADERFRVSPKIQAVNEIRDTIQSHHRTPGNMVLVQSGSYTTIQTGQQREVLQIACLDSRLYSSENTCKSIMQSDEIVAITAKAKSGGFQGISVIWCPDGTECGSLGHGKGYMQKKALF